MHSVRRQLHFSANSQHGHVVLAKVGYLSRAFCSNTCSYEYLQMGPCIKELGWYALALHLIQRDKTRCIVHEVE